MMQSLGFTLPFREAHDQCSAACMCNSFSTAAMQYGGSLVPDSHSSKDVYKPATALEVLGFAARADIPRHCFMKVVPACLPVDHEQFAAQHTVPLTLLTC